MRAISSALAAIMVTTALQAATAQATVDAGSSVRIILSDRSVVSGRLSAADSFRLTMLSGPSATTIDRALVTRLERRSSLAKPFAIGLSIGGAVLAGIAGSTARSECDVSASAFPGSSCGRPHNLLGVDLLAGGLIGAVGGAFVGTFFPSWQRADSASTIAEERYGPFGTPRCGDDASIAIAIAAQPHEGGHAERVAMSLGCEPATTTSIEAAVLWPGQKANTWFSGNDASVVYSGLAIERRIARLPLDPRFVVGIGVYHGNPRQGFRNGAGWEAFELGGSIGLNLGMQLSRTASIRLEGREHAFHGSIGTLGLGLEYRP